MTRQPWSDDELIGELRAALAEEGLPADFAEAARAAYSWRTVDAELTLLETVFDSAAPQGALATRAAAPASECLLVFDADGCRIDAELGPDGLVAGQISPPAPGTVRCQSAAGPFAESPVGEDGCFTVPLPAAGAIRLRVTDGDRSVVTDWVNPI